MKIQDKHTLFYTNLSLIFWHYYTREQIGTDWTELKSVRTSSSIDNDFDAAAQVYLELKWLTSWSVSQSTSQILCFKFLVNITDQVKCFLNTNASNHLPFVKCIEQISYIWQGKSITHSLGDKIVFYI